MSLSRGKVIETYEIFGRCSFVGKKFRFGNPRVTEGAQIDYRLTEHWLYFVDTAGKTHKALFIEQRLIPAPPVMAEKPN